MSVHDEFCGRGIGSALLAAFIDLSDNWLNLKRLELTVYVDNEPAIRLYKKFGLRGGGNPSPGRVPRRTIRRLVLHGATAARMEHAAMTLELDAPAVQPVALRSARPEDFAFCRRITHEGMRWIVERLFGWDEAQQAEKFASQWRLDEARIIMCADEDVGWLQTRPTEDSIFLCQLHLDTPFHGRGIGSRVMQIVIDEARRDSKAVTLEVVKINPARRLYERLGFRTTGEDEYKFHMRREADTTR
jgi:ribosomal protein S18 acetylase RimI-like enzyme